MYVCSVLSQVLKSKSKSVFGVLSIFALVWVTATNVSAITTQEVMENALEIYEDINDYKAVVHTYQAPSMDVSGSIFDTQNPILSFNLFFRKPNEHAVKEIGKSRYGIFRIELLSTLEKLTDKNIKLKQRETLLGHNCYVLEFTSPDEPDTVINLWISSKSWTLQQFTLIMKSLTIVKTQFKYPVDGNRRLRFLPVETRSFFPISKKHLINRITNYEMNTNLSPKLFEKRKDKEQ